MPNRNGMAELRLEDFAPVPMLCLPQNRPTRMPVSAVDVHNHLGRWHSGSWSCPDVAELLTVMDDCNVQTIVNLDGGWGSELDANLVRYDLAHPGRFVTFCRLDWSDCATQGWGQRLAASLHDSIRRGAAGLKVWKDLGLRLRDEKDQLFFLDDDRLEPVWEAVAEARAPVLVHTADPVAFFRPLDERNERAEELLAHPDWHFSDNKFPPFERLLDAMETTIANHADVTFIGAHVGCYAENLTWVDRMLSTYPNFNIDIAQRIAELGRQPRASRKLFLKHPTRVLLGTDAFPPRRDDYAVYSRFLTTEDEHFPYSDKTPPETGRWAISAVNLPADVLSSILAKNARRLIPKLAQSQVTTNEP